MKLASRVTSQDHAQGSDDALVTLVEYGDYQCPDCGRAHGVVLALKERFGPALRFVFRNMPLRHAHRYAELAARTAEAAAIQNQFWPMHDLLFEHQRQLGPDLVVEIATGLKLDLDRLEQDANDRRVIDRVQHDVDTGLRSGVEGTPTFYINGVRYDDEADEPTLAAVLAEIIPASGRKSRSHRSKPGR